MPGGKRAGVRCAQLTPDNRCALFGSPDRPAVCGSYQPTRDYCGWTQDEALSLLARLEQDTAAR